MTFSSGARLGSYEIVSPLGSGGMGEVYQAHDTRLGREVAIKVLPDVFLKDPERLARFEREARVMASLNHPSVGAIHGLEESDGRRFLVLELVPGETLAQRLSQGPLEMEDALKICRQIAEALEAAHEKGIIHRDLKPSNVKVTDEEKVKVLDFGLAKALAPEESSPALSMSPTLTMPSMQSGVILGTAAYMSPEQARGKSLDKRTDIWSFGCVLYETLTGKQAFSGETISDTIGAILHLDPDWKALPEKTPASIHELLRRCLQKDRNQRLRDIGDARIEIDEALKSPALPLPHSPALPLPPSPALPQVRRHERLAWSVLSALLLVAACAFAFLYFHRAPPEERVYSFSVVPPEKVSYQGWAAGISPDGRRLIFRAISEGKFQLWVRPLDSLSARPLSGTENVSFSWWSPDSQFVLFVAGTKLKKVDISGGPPQTLCDGGPFGASWNQEGVIVFANQNDGTLYRVLAAGGAPVQLTPLDNSRQETWHRWPSFLPDGRHFLYLARSPQSTDVYLGSLDSKETKRLVSADSGAHYAPPGYLLFLRETNLLAQAFDIKDLRITGEPIAISEEVERIPTIGYASFSVSQNGILSYRSGGARQRNRLIWFDRTGKELETVGAPGAYNDLNLSPDNKRLVVGRADETSNFDLWLIELSRGVPSRFTFDPAQDWCGIWHPDGSRIVFSSNRKGIFDLYQKISSGAGNEEMLLQTKEPKWSHDWSRDGRFIVYSSNDAKTKRDLWILPLLGDRKPYPYLRTEFDETQGQFSPDGRWMAYASDVTGTSEVYVQPFPATGGQWQISNGGGAQPRWRRDGKELFYLAADRKLMAVELRPGPTFEPGIPKPLFDTHVWGPPLTATVIRYAVASDGKRFLVNTTPDTISGAPITVVVNWVAKLKR